MANFNPVFSKSIQYSEGLTRDTTSFAAKATRKADVQMKIHEYQAKELVTQYSPPTPDGGLCHTTQEIVRATGELSFPVAFRIVIQIVN